MVRTHSHRGRVRLALASGGLVSLVALTTTAAFTDFADLAAQVDGTRNTLDIVAAGSADPTWSPGPRDWAQADDEALLIDLGDSTELPPGSTRLIRIAVKNDSPRVNGDIALTLSDPDPLGDETDPATGRFLELFDQLEFVFSEAGQSFFSTTGAAPASERRHAWAEPFAPGGVRDITVAITLPADTDDRWQQAQTQIQFGFEAVNSSA